MKTSIRESTTIKFVLVSWLLMNYMWLSGHVKGTLTEYATACGLILAVWLGREWRVSHYKERQDADRLVD